MECYASDGGPCAARARTSPEDFRVEERLLGLEISSLETPGYLPLYRVEKRSVDTMHMARELAAALKSRVSYAGLKDKNAFAVQFVTPTSRRGTRPKEVHGRGFDASLVGFVERPLSRSALAGNRFEIVLRDCCPEIGERIQVARHLGDGRRIPNFYGLQRFGSAGAGSHTIGKALVTASFEGAVKTMLVGAKSAAPHESEEAFARGDYTEVARLLPPGKDVERQVARELSRHPGQWAKALRAVPVRLRRLYVQAYQSLIFNKTLSSALASGEDISRLEKGDNWAPTAEGGLVTLPPRGVKETPCEGAVPLVQVVGYAFRNYGSRFDRIIGDVLEKEGVSPGQFYVKDLQEISSEGAFRRPHLALRDTSWDVDGTRAQAKFTLGKGQYATTLLREIVKPVDPAGAGFA